MMSVITSIEHGSSRPGAIESYTLSCANAHIDEGRIDLRITTIKLVLGTTLYPRIDTQRDQDF
jgi:hypothetical protein